MPVGAKSAKSADINIINVSSKSSHTKKFDISSLSKNVKSIFRYLIYEKQLQLGKYLNLTLEIN